MIKDRTKRIIAIVIAVLLLIVGASVGGYYLFHHDGDLCKNCKDTEKCMNKKCVPKSTSPASSSDVQWSPSSYSQLKDKITKTSSTPITDPAILSCIANNVIQKYANPKKVSADSNFESDLQNIINGCTNKNILDPGNPSFCEKSCTSGKCGTDGCGGICNCPELQYCDDSKQCQDIPDHWTLDWYNQLTNAILSGNPDLKGDPMLICIANNICHKYPNPQSIKQGDPQFTKNLNNIMKGCNDGSLKTPDDPIYSNHKTKHPKKPIATQKPIVTQKPGKRIPIPHDPSIPEESKSVFNFCKSNGDDAGPVNCVRAIMNCANSQPWCTQNGNCQNDISGAAQNYCTSIHGGGGYVPGGQQSQGTYYCDTTSCQCVKGNKGGSLIFQDQYSCQDECQSGGVLCGEKYESPWHGIF